MPTRRYENLEPDRKKAILDAAQAEFTLSGYEGASLNKIIADAGISKGSFYYYFEDKADLYVTALERVGMEFIERVGGIYKGEYSDDFWGDIEQMARRSYAVFSEKPELVQFSRGIMHLSMHNMHHPALQHYIDQMYEMFFSVFRRGREMGAVRTDVPLELLVSMTIAVGEGSDRWLFEHYEELSGEEIDRVLGFTLDIMKQIAGSQSQPSSREVT